MHSADHIVNEWQDMQAGDQVRLAAEVRLATVSPEIIYIFDDRVRGLNGSCVTGPGVMPLAGCDRRSRHRPVAAVAVASATSSASSSAGELVPPCSFVRCLDGPDCLVAKDLTTCHRRGAVETLRNADCKHQMARIWLRR